MRVLFRQVENLIDFPLSPTNHFVSICNPFQHSFNSYKFVGFYFFTFPLNQLYHLPDFPTDYELNKILKAC